MENDEGPDFTVDMNGLNRLLNMYTYTLPQTPPLNSTNAPNPLPSSVNNLYHSPISNVSELYHNTEPLYISEAKDLKKNLIDILYKKTDFEDEEFDIEKYENKELDELYDKIKSFNEDLKIYQEKLYLAEKNLNEEIDKMNKNVQKIDNFIKFLENLSSIDYEEIKDIVKSINVLSSKLSNMDSFKEAKKNYVTERKNILKYIYLLKKVNKLNISNTCVICMEDPVSHFIDPCGHTFCKKCLENSLEINDINEENTIRTKKCNICRNFINNLKPLYFL